MRRFPLLVLAGILGIKKRRSVDASSGGRVPDSKNLATSMSFVNALSRAHLAPVAVDRCGFNPASNVPLWNESTNLMKFNAKSAI
jgi:hypothetical protein